ncbi:MAG: 7-cyano-7-deazaguanine synthase [Acholeplasmataceae bacterium]|nr:7-cyano-7-deazaguanine synthase [Acholeplasmataceae bacterium]
MYQVTILLSGGIDSSVLLAFLLDQKIKCTPFFIDYGQITAKVEYKSAKSISEYYGLELELIRISEVSKLTSNQITNPDQSKDPFYPNRNLLLLTLATLYAYEKDHDGVGIGVIKSLGTASFPDIMPEFFNKFSCMISTSLGRELSILTPFVDITKLEVVEIGKRLNVPFELTYSCLTNHEEPCGKCDSCKSRENALRGF